MKKRSGQNICLLFPFLFLCSLPVHLTSAATVAAEVTTGEKKAQEQNHGHYRSDRSGPLTFPGMEGGTARFISPSLEVFDLNMEGDKIERPSTGVDNYHVIVVEKTEADMKDVVIQYKYMRGKPSGHSPTEVTAFHKTDFEIVPAPIPREHMRYLTGDEWKFILKFNNNPVTNHDITIETENGSIMSATTDKDGSITVNIPDDFPNIVEGERDRRSAFFNITSNYYDGGIRYRTTFKNQYSVNRSHWQSTEIGFLSVVLGFLLGLIINRSGKNSRREK